MADTYEIRLAYPDTLRINTIITLIESVPGVRIRKLDVQPRRGRQFSVFFLLEIVDRLRYNKVMKRIRARKGIVMDEQV